jgi:hypothetical protein
LRDGGKWPPSGEESLSFRNLWREKKIELILYKVLFPIKSQESVAFPTHPKVKKLFFKKSLCQRLKRNCVPEAGEKTLDRVSFLSPPLK